MSTGTALRLEPQAALEEATAAALRQTLGYSDAQCQRMFDGQPPAGMGQLFVAVWYTGERRGEGDRQYLGMRFGVNATITLRITQPADRWVKHRDEIERRANAIAALLCKDGQTRNICNAANVLCEFDTGGRPIGFREGLKFQRYGPLEEKGDDWFSAMQGKGTEGLAQTIYFGEVLRVQAVGTAS